jgi:murein DD-endopeptidase MepM/ murein hydrolase activator NlpD
MGQFDWLAYGVTNGYSTTQIPGNGDSPHFANDIGTPFHTPITALFSGTVKEQKTGLPWGTEVFIQPDNPNLPEYYYYHLDTLDTHVGQHLTAGQFIGLSGGQNRGGTNPSTPDMSSGPHTHVGFFTSWKNTVLGTRPFGPDISPYIDALAKGQSLPNGVANPSTGTPIPSSGTQASTGPNLQGFAVKAGLFVAALLLVGFGAYIAFKPQADELVKKGLKAAEIGAVA